MSTASKVTLGLSVTFTIGIITYVHQWQKRERQRMHEGVIMDLERQLGKKGGAQDMQVEAPSSGAAAVLNQK